MCNFSGDVQSRDPQIRSGAGSRAPPQALHPASGKGTGSARLRAPGPSCPLGHLGEVGSLPPPEPSAPQSLKSLGSRGRGRQAAPPQRSAPAWGHLRLGGCGRLRLVVRSLLPGTRTDPGKVRQRQRAVGAGGIRLAAAGCAGRRRRAHRAGRSGRLPAPPCAARRQSEPRRRRRSAEPGAARAGGGGETARPRALPSGRGRVRTEPRGERQRRARPPASAPRFVRPLPGLWKQQILSAAMASPRAWSCPRPRVAPSPSERIQSISGRSFERERSMSPT